MPVAEGDVPYLRSLQTTLNDAVRRAAAATGVTYVDMNRVSEGHDACQPLGVRWIEPVLQGTNPVVVHPNALGEQQMAAQAMRSCGWLRTARHRAAGAAARFQPVPRRLTLRAREGRDRDRDRSARADLTRGVHVRKKLIIATTAGVLALGGGLAFAVPALAGDETSTTREDRIRDALAGLVEDGSITDAQADEVATTLAGSGLGGHGHGHGGGGRLDLSAAATALDMTEDELRDALPADDTSLADVAEQQGVEVDALVDALVAAHRSGSPSRRGRVLTRSRPTSARPPDEQVTSAWTATTVRPTAPGAATPTAEDWAHPAQQAEPRRRTGDAVRRTPGGRVRLRRGLRPAVVCR